jgi:hypothetical protein
MLLNDLEYGYMLVLRNGTKVINSKTGFINILTGEHEGETALYNDNLTNIDRKYKEYDIMEVYSHVCYGGLLYRRKEITDEDMKNLSLLYKLGFRYITRDKDGEITVFENKPFKDDNVWDCVYEYLAICLNELPIFKDYNGFTFINWEDEQPTIIDSVVDVSLEG